METFTSTQVETRLPSTKPRRSLLPGPKSTTCSVKTTVRSISLPAPTSPNSGFKHLSIGQEVTTSDGRIGVLRFKGKAHFTQGYLCGIELYKPNGKNDGSVDGIHYFECVEPHGLFVPAYKVFPTDSHILNGQSKSSRTPGFDVKGQRKLQTSTSKRIPRPKSLPFSEGTFQRDRKCKSKSGNGQLECYSVKVSCTSKTKDRQSCSSSKLQNRKVSPLNTSITCPAWLGKDHPRSPNSRFSQKECLLNNTFTIPDSLQCTYSTRRKHPKSRESKNSYLPRDVTPERDGRGRLGSVPSFQDLSSIGGSSEDIGTLTRPDIVEDCQGRVNQTFDIPVESGLTYDIGSQGSLSTWEDNSASCEKSNSSLAWDFDIPASSTPVELHVRVATDRKPLLSDDTEDFLSTDDEVEYNEFLAIPTYLDTPTGRCKFDLLTPEELEQALNESNLYIPDELRDGHHDDELLLTLSNFEKTPIWEPITPVEEEFLPFTVGSTLDPNPLAFWSMDSVPLKTDIAPEQQPNIEGSVEMEFTTSTALRLENGVNSMNGEVSSDIPCRVHTNGFDHNYGVDSAHSAGLSPVDLLEGVNDDTLLFVNGGERNGYNNGMDGGVVPPVMVELMIDTNSQHPEYSDSSSCSNRTVTENINGLEMVVDSVTNDLKQALIDSENVKEDRNKTFEKELEINAEGQKRKSLLIKPKMGVKPNTKLSNKVDINVTRGLKNTRADPSNKPPVPPKLSVIPRRRPHEPGRASAKLTEVKSRINTGRISVDSTEKQKVTSVKKELKVTKRTSFQLRTEKDRVRKQSSSSATSDNRADSKGSVNSSRPSSRSDGSTDDVSSTRKPPRTSTVTSGSQVSQTKEKLQKNNVTKIDAAPTRRSGFAVPPARKPLSSVDGTKNRKNLLAKDPKQAKIKKLKPQSGSSTPPDVVYASIPDVRTNEEVKRLETLCNTQTKQLDTACKQIKVNAKAFEAMAVLVQYLTQHCDAFAVPVLKKRVNSLEIQIKETSKQIAAQEREITRLGVELSENKKYHEKELEALKESHEQEMGTLRKDLQEQHESAVESLNQSHSERLQREAERYQTMAQEAEMYKNQLEEQQMEHLEYVTNMEQTNEQQSIEEECRHEQAIVKLKAEAKLREQVLQDENLALSFRSDNLQGKIRMLEDALQKDSDAKVQAAMEQFQHLPEEVESLKTVLAMKNKEIQDKRIAIMALEKKVSKIPAKEDKVKRLEAKVEDLNALVESKICYERQLSSEQVTLRVNFQKETNTNKRLSMENEELQWKLNQSVVSPGSLTPPRFNPSPVPSSPLTSRTPLFRANSNSSDSHESGVFSPQNLQL